MGHWRVSSLWCISSLTCWYAGCSATIAFSRRLVTSVGLGCLSSQGHFFRRCAGAMLMQSKRVGGHLVCCHSGTVDPVYESLQVICTPFQRLALLGAQSLQLVCLPSTCLHQLADAACRYPSIRDLVLESHVNSTCKPAWMFYYNGSCYTMSWRR